MRINQNEEDNSTNDSSPKLNPKPNRSGPSPDDVSLDTKPNSYIITDKDTFNRIIYLNPIKIDHLITGYIKQECNDWSIFETGLIPTFIEFARFLFKLDKVCIGDKVRITKTNQKLVNEIGIIKYIGYPYPDKGIRYGIALESAKGDFDGSLMINIKTGKLAKANHLKKYRKQIKKRKFFKCKKNHGLFVKFEEITGIDRALSSVKTRFTIEDKVEVRFRGIGKIKFIGNLEHTKEMGIWYGIQLKERRGRHDGTVNSVKYFECAAQYGLHCRQNHLKLVEPDKQKQNKAIPSQSENRPRLRQSINDKSSKSNKWAS